jgi:Protein of unknown function (DUF3177)
LPPRAIKLTLTAWRWAITAYCALGALAWVPFLQCGVSANMLKTDYCQAWFQPPLLYKQFLHSNVAAPTLGAFAVVALVVYTFSFGYFLVVRLGKQGRTAIDS